MALKIWTNGSMKKIDTNLHKPIIFLNGTKYKLDKAWVFVNGEKKEIWGEGGVQVDYISSDGILGGGYPFAISENWLNCYYNHTIYRLDISNLSSPSLVQSVAWGNLIRYNHYQSTANTKVFEGWNNATRTNYKYLLDNTTGSMTVASSLAFTPTSSSTNISDYLGATNNYFIDVFSTLVSMRPYQLWNRTSYWNNTAKFGTSSVAPMFLYQNGNNTFIAKFTENATTSLYQYSDSVKTIVGGTPFTPVYYYSAYSPNVGAVTLGPAQLFTDSNYVYYAPNTGGVAKRPIGDLTQEIAYTDIDEGEILRLLGKINNYIYCLKIPSDRDGTPDSVVKLILLNDTDLTPAFEKVLPNDPFNENYGYPTFWTNYSASTVPQVSETGFLSFGSFDNSGLKLRVARFSGIF